MPHIHGVAWISQTELDKRTIKDGLLCAKKNSEAVVTLADQLISCHLPNIEDKSTKEPESKKGALKDDEKHPSLGKIVRETQIHRHTPSCLKYNGICRYNFPRLPCTKTVVARPFEEQNDLKLKYFEEGIFDKLEFGRYTFRSITSRYEPYRTLL